MKELKVNYPPNLLVEDNVKEIIQEAILEKNNQKPGLIEDAKRFRVVIKLRWGNETNLLQPSVSVRYVGEKRRGKFPINNIVKVISEHKPENGKRIWRMFPC